MKIAFVTYPGFTMLDLIGPIDVLSRLPNAESLLVASEPGLLANDNNVVSFNVDAGLDAMPDPDIVVVPGGMEGTFAAAEDERLLSWLRTAAETTTWMTSVCTGSIILGAAGLLDGKTATCHWASMDNLAATGAIPTKERVVMHPGLVTAAGVSAGIDMALTLAAEIVGEDHAKLLQLAIEYDPQPPFDAGNPTSAGPELTALCESFFAS